MALSEKVSVVESVPANINVKSTKNGDKLSAENQTNISYNTKKMDQNVAETNEDPLLFAQLNQAVGVPSVIHSPPFQHHLSSNSISYYAPQPVAGSQLTGPLLNQYASQEPIVETWKSELLHEEEEKIKSLDVKCEKSRMRVHIEFARPFNGIVFSKGHFRNRHCVHIEEYSAIASKTFEIGTHSCGTINNLESLNHYKGYDSNNYFENIIIIQFDPQVQQKTDQARKLRCTWHDHYEKEITFQPLAIDTLDVIQTDFSGDNVGCWMQIQKGEGPWAREASGLVKIGQLMTMVLAIKDNEHKFDMLVRNCVAHDGKKKPITLVDEYGCVVRPKIMSNFQKMKNVEKSASVLSFAKFYAFKFPDSMEVHFQCTIQICRNQCPNQCYKQELMPTLSQYDSIPVVSNFHHRRRISPAADALPRDQRKIRNYRRFGRSINNDSKKIGLDSTIQVISNEDLVLSLLNETDSLDDFDMLNNTLTSYFNSEKKPSVICMTTIGFSVTLLILLAVLIVSCFLAIFFFLKSNTSAKKPKWHLRYF